MATPFDHCHRAGRCGHVRFDPVNRGGVRTPAFDLGEDAGADCGHLGPVLFALDGRQDSAAEAAHLTQQQPAFRFQGEVRAVGGEAGLQHYCQPPGEVTAVGSGSQQEDVRPPVDDDSRSRVGVCLGRELRQQGVRNVDHPVEVEVGCLRRQFVEAVPGEQSGEFGPRLARELAGLAQEFDADGREPRFVLFEEDPDAAGHRGGVGGLNHGIPP